MSNYSPGPWKWSGDIGPWGGDDGPAKVLDAREIIVANEIYRDADARLIADAPALLAGLDEALTLMYDAHPFDCDDSPDYQRLRALVRRHEAP